MPFITPEILKEKFKISCALLHAKRVILRRHLYLLGLVLVIRHLPGGRVTGEIASKPPFDGKEGFGNYSEL